jgi:hypothetical protein
MVSRKIALFLIMVMLVNMVAWADDGLDPELEGALWVVVGVLLLIAIFAPIIGSSATSEADAPDDGIRLVSMQNVPLEQKGSFGSFLNVLQHVNAGYTPENNKAFLGLNFKF